MASGVYYGWLADLMNGNVDMVNDTLKIGLLDDNHTFTSSDDTWADVSANEISGTGYTAGGGTLDNTSVTEAATTKFDADDEAWTTATFTAYHAVIYDTSNADSLVCSIDLGGGQAVVAGTFTLQFDADGIVTLA